MHRWRTELFRHLVHGPDVEIAIIEQRQVNRTPPVRTAGQVRDDRLPADFRDERFASAETSSTSDSVSTALGSKSSAIHSVSSAWRSC
jgi:hypothetical protein